MEEKVRKDRSNTKRIRAIEGSFALLFIIFLLFQLLSFILKKTPSGDFEFILFSTFIMFLSALTGFLSGLFLRYFYYLYGSFFNDFFRESKFRKIFLIVIIIALVAPFLTSSILVIFSKPLEDIKDIMAIIASIVVIIGGLVGIMYRIKKK